VFFLVAVPYHVIGKLETAADDFQVSSRFPYILLLFAMIYMELFLQYIWDKTGLGTQVPVPWINRNTAPSKSKIALEKKYELLINN
jgi:hypothetical protein